MSQDIVERLRHEAQTPADLQPTATAGSVMRLAAAEIESLRARVARKDKALDSITRLTTGWPHIDAKEGMRLALEALDSARNIARAVLAEGE